MSGLTEQYNSVVARLSEELMIDCCNEGEIKSELKQTVPYYSEAELADKVKAYLMIPCNPKDQEIEGEFAQFLKVMIPFPRILFQFAYQVARSFPADDTQSDQETFKKLQLLTANQLSRNSERIKSVGKLYFHILKTMVPEGYELKRFLPKQHCHDNKSIVNPIIEMPWEFVMIDDFCFLESEKNLYLFNSTLHSYYYEYGSQAIAELGFEQYSMITHQLIDEGGSIGYFNGFTSWRYPTRVMEKYLSPVHIKIFKSHITRLAHNKINTIDISNYPANWLQAASEYKKSLMERAFPLWC